MKTLLRGGYVVSGRGCRRADVLIDGEKVEMLGHIPPELAAQSEVVDVAGCMLFPGFIDAHTHFDLDVCNTTTADDFESGSKSAIRGGTTTVIGFACGVPLIHWLLRLRKQPPKAENDIKKQSGKDEQYGKQGKDQPQRNDGDLHEQGAGNGQQ